MLLQYFTAFTPIQYAMKEVKSIQVVQLLSADENTEYSTKKLES